MARRKDDYFIYADMISVMECSFDKSLKDFYARLPYIEKVVNRGYHIHMHLEWGSNYYQNVGFDKVEYRDRNGDIVTLLSNMENHNSYSASTFFYGADGHLSIDERYTQTELPYNNEYGIYDWEEPYNKNGLVDLYDLVMNKINRENPYLHIHMKGEKGSTDEEKAYWRRQGWYKGNQFTRNTYINNVVSNHVKDSTGKPAVCYLDYISITFKPPVYKTVSASRDHVNKTYSLLPICEGISLTDYDIEIWDINYDGNGSNKMTYSMEARPGNAPTVVPFNKLQKGTNRVVFKLYNHNATVEQSFDLNHLSPTISDLSLDNKNNLVDSDTIVTWSSTNQSGAAIYIDGKLFKKFDGATQSTVIPKGTLKVGKNKITVNVLNYFGTDVESVSSYKEITLSRIESQITENSLKLDGYNIDKDIKVSWQSTNQTKFKIYQGDILVASKTSSDTSYIVPKGKLKHGKYKFKLIVVYSGACGDVEAENIIDVTFTRNEPIIYNIEPSNLNIDVDVSRIISFSTNAFVDNWELSFAGLVTKGTDSRQVTVSPNVFNVGENRITLTVFYSPDYDKSDIRKATKTVTFTGYGTPDKPYIICDSVISTATPCFNWMFAGQTAYQVILLKGEEVLEDTGELFNSNTEFIASTELEDNTEYTLKIRCRGNKKWSNFSVRTFTTKFSDIELPKFYLFESEKAICISIYGKQPKDFDVLSIYRKDEISNKWVEIAFNCNVKDSIIDRICPANVELSYKLRVYNRDGAYRDSDIKTITLTLNSYVLTKVSGDMADFKLVETNVEYEHNTDSIVKLYAGSKLPIIFNGNQNYITGNIEAIFKNEEAIKFIKYFENNATYCLRDIRGKRLFVKLAIDSEKPIGFKKVSFSISFTEISFNEARISEGIGRIKYTYVDGEYKLNGSIDLSGVDENYYS